MIGDSCVGDTKLYPLNLFSFTHPISFIVLLIIRTYLWYKDLADRAPGDKSNLPNRSSFGIGSVFFLKQLCGLGLAYTFSNTALFFIFYYSQTANSLEYACQVKTGYIGIAIPFFLVLIAVLILGTNKFREVWVRFKFANCIDEFLEKVHWEDVESSMESKPEDKPIRVLIMSSHRGVWVLPIVKKLVEKYGKGVEVICLDAYQTKFNKESDDWIRINMAVDGIDNYVKILWTDFQSISLPRNFADIVIVPTGNRIPYLRQSLDPEESKALLLQFLSNINKVLKPGGRLISSNLVVYQSAWINGLIDSSFTEVINLPYFLFWSYIPARITICKKSTTIQEVKRNVIPSDESTYTNVTRSTYSVKKMSLQTGHQINEYTRPTKFFPRGWHWRLVEVLIFVSIVLWALFVIFTWYWLGALAVPTFMPYAQMVSSLFISNSLLLPFTFYVILRKLRKEAQKVDDMHNTTREMSNARLDSFDAVGPQQFVSSSLLAPPPLSNETGGNNSSYNAIKMVLRCYLAQGFDVAVILILYTALGWLPYFVVDVFLISYATVSTSTLSYINTAIGIVVSISFVYCAKALAIFYYDYKDKQENVLNLASKLELNVAVSTEEKRTSIRISGHQLFKSSEIELHTKDAVYPGENRTVHF